MQLANLEDVLVFFFCFFYLAVNKLTAEKKNAKHFHLIAEHSSFIKYTLNKLDTNFKRF